MEQGVSHTSLTTQARAYATHLELIVRHMYASNLQEPFPMAFLIEL